MTRKIDAAHRLIKTAVPVPEGIARIAYDYMRTYRGKFYMCECSEVCLQNNKFCPACGARLEKIDNRKVVKV